MKRMPFLNVVDHLISLFGTVLIIIFLMGCKKESPNEPDAHEIRFTYNGVEHKLTSGWLPHTLFDVTTFRFVYEGGFSISRPDLFGGTINVKYDRPSRTVTCAWLQPENYPTITSLDCNDLNVAGGPIDSVRVFWLHSVSYNESFTYCNPTINPQFKKCGLAIDFSLTLVNKNNEQIKLTNGKALSVVDVRL